MSKSPGEEAKLPVQQLVILAIARFSEPLALTSIFPYLPEMIRSFGVEENKIAKWAGITSAAFSVSQSLAAVPWGRASDRLGRKPTIIMGLSTTMILFLLWGVSTNLPMAITVRLLLGAGNGNVGIIRTMVAEMVSEKHLQPRAFVVMPLVWSIGSIFGPAFGGMFVKPVERYPSLFGNSQFFKAYPFALPNLIMAVFFLVSVGVAICFLKETLESRRHQKDWGLRLGHRLARTFRRRSHNPSRTRRASFVDGEATAPLLPTRLPAEETESPAARHPVASPTMREVFTVQTSIGLVAYTFLALHSVAFDQVLPVFLNHPEQERTPENTSLPFRFTGGFGLGSDKIGTIFALYGIACGLIQFLCFPPICNRFGVLNCFRFCAIVSPFIYFLTPYTVLFSTTNGRYAALLSLMLVKAFSVIFGFPCIIILLTNSASSLRVLGTLNGFATMFSGLGRAIGPAGVGAAFTWGMDRGYVITAWWLLGATAAVGAIPALMIVEGEGPGGSPPSAEETEEEEDVDENDNAVLSDSDDDGLDEDTLTGSRYTNKADTEAEGEHSTENTPLLRGRG